MSHVQCFPPVARQDARVLILGSMPGKASLEANEYYAHPQNVFWPIVRQLLGVAADAPYRQRLTALKENRIALWDVLQACTRQTSLDSDIVESSIVVNDLAGFFASHPLVTQVLFNGTKAEVSFRRYILPELLDQADRLQLMRLPSTSPANATWSRAEKLAAWRDALEGQIQAKRALSQTA